MTIWEIHQKIRSFSSTIHGNATTVPPLSSKNRLLNGNVRDPLRPIQYYDIIYLHENVFFFKHGFFADPQQCSHYHIIRYIHFDNYYNHGFYVQHIVKIVGSPWFIIGNQHKVLLKINLVVLRFLSATCVALATLASLQIRSPMLSSSPIWGIQELSREHGAMFGR